MNTQPSVPVPSSAFAFCVADATRLTGIPRSGIYRLLAGGQIVARKLGRRTLIEGESLRAFINGLPLAEFRAPRRGGAA